MGRVSAAEGCRARGSVDRGDAVALDCTGPRFVQDRPAREQVTVAREAHVGRVGCHRAHRMTTGDRLGCRWWGVFVCHRSSAQARFAVVQFEPGDRVGTKDDRSRNACNLEHQHPLVGFGECGQVKRLAITELNTHGRKALVAIAEGEDSASHHVHELGSVAPVAEVLERRRW